MSCGHPKGGLSLVRMYLSSFGLGDRPRLFVRLLDEAQRVLVVANGLDGEDPATRTGRVGGELEGLRAIGTAPVELDLRDHVGGPEDLRRRLEDADGLWLRGGNLFVVRALLFRTGGDRMIADLVRQDRLVLGGYSVAPAIVGPSLRGFERTDDVDAATELTGMETVWDGLGLLPEVIVPHCDSPQHPASTALGQLADDLERTQVPVIRLRDGQALIVDGARTLIA